MPQVAQTGQSITDPDPNNLTQILVIDDDANLRFIYSQALQQAGYEVYLAETIETARDLLVTHRFNVFISDTHLGGRDCGIDFLREQVEALTGNGTHIIITSCDASYQPLCDEIGPNTFIEKPVAIEHLIALVDRLTGQH